MRKRHQNGRERQIVARAKKWSQILRQYHESGEGRREFARKHGIARSTFDYWLLREKRQELKAVRAGRADNLPTVVLGEVKFDNKPDWGGDCSWAMEVVGPTGLTIRIRKELPYEVLIRLLGGKEC